MQMLLSSSSLCFSVSSRASCLALSAASMSFLAVWELSDSWEPARCKQHVKWRQESEYCSEAESEAEGEIACAPASLAGCLQGSEWNVSIRRKGQFRTKSVTHISKTPRWCQSCLKTTHTLPVTLCFLLSHWPLMWGWRTDGHANTKKYWWKCFC